MLQQVNDRLSLLQLVFDKNDKVELCNVWIQANILVLYSM